MSNYPYILDDDTTILRVDDNISEISGENFNQVRDAIFKIEEELGIKPAGSMDNLNEFLDVSHNDDGTIKASALASVGLVTLPIDNAQVGAHAGILESKLALDYSTSSLYTLIAGNITSINTLTDTTSGLTTTLNLHMGGGPTRHFASHIDMDVPLPGTTTVEDALHSIDTELTDHETNTGAHDASNISVDTSGFVEISAYATDVQAALGELDSLEGGKLVDHRATMHSAGVPVDARSQALQKIGENGQIDTAADGYGETVVSSRAVQAYVASTTGTAPVDSVTAGDNIVRFIPPVDAIQRRVLDAEFCQVVPGDILRINYGGFEGQYVVESVRYVPGSEYYVRLDSNNLLNTATAFARIDRPVFDSNIYGVAIAAPSNATPVGHFPGFFSSVTLADPRCASVLGIGFDPKQIDEEHYKLYLQIYPTGNPLDDVVTLPYIDVSGNAGATPGKYTLDSVVLATNNAFRAAGYNFRFVAFQYTGNFGIALSDPFNGAAFSIISGDWSSGSAAEGSYTENVIGDSNPDGKAFDALGLGYNSSGWASPAYRNSYLNNTDAQRPTKIIMPRKERYYISNGTPRDYLRSSVGVYDGYYDANITQRVETVYGVETTYTISGKLDTEGLLPGKTITVLPTIELSDPLYLTADYGRFIIKTITYQDCPGFDPLTVITVINGIHGTGDPLSPSSDATFPYEVRIHLGNDTVGFNLNHMIDGTTPAPFDYHRFYEIYVDQNAKTFSHERARMPIQASSGDYLGTSNWHINYVSPKLRGYLESSTLNKYVRLKVLTYDTTSGEFTVQLGQRTNPPVGVTVLNPGETVTARKNVPFKVYDETGNDYIELEVTEETTSASTINDNSIVDIEVFPTLALNDERLLLAVCELNWDPDDNLLVDRVRDVRPVGSVSELDFTQSAKQFITSGDRALHANGVVRDLGYVGVSTTDPAALLFNGGIALVNGTIVNVNNGKVVIPELVENGGGSGSTVEWIICINESGSFVAHPLTTTKQHFFAQAGTGGMGEIPYFIPSVTFAEVVNERKDLVPLLTLTATITSVAISNETDVRRFVADESNNISLVWAEDDSKSSASFRSAEALMAWATKLTDGSIYSKSRIIVRGNITLDSSLDLRAVPNLTLEGEGPGTAKITVNGNNGLFIGSNATIKNLEFEYNAVSGTANITGVVYPVLYGCIIVYSTTDIQNITIENCVFNSISLNRMAFVAVILDENDVDNLRIKNNRFSDAGASALDIAAITIANYNNDASPHSVLTDVFIEENVCNADQGIFIVGNAAGTIPPIACRNVHISRNHCGYIGVTSSSNLTGAVGTYKTGLHIADNTCKLIYGAVDREGLPRTGLGLSNVAIRGNTCSNIYLCGINGVSEAVGVSGIIVDGNFLTYTTYTAPSGTDPTMAIRAIGSGSGIQIANNKIYSPPATLYASGIVTTMTNSIVSGNIIEGFSNYGIGSGGNSIIQNNRILRKSGNILNYIYTTSGGCLISNNYLDSTTVDVDGKNWEDTIGGVVSATTDNINHIRQFNLRSSHGAVEYNAASTSGIWYCPSQISPGSDPILFRRSHSNNYKQQLLYYYSVGGSSTVYWVIPLRGIVPDHATIIDAELTASSNTTFSNQSDIWIGYNYGNGDYTEAVPINFDSIISEQTRSITINRVVSEDDLQLYVKATLESVEVIPFLIHIISLSVVFRWCV